MDSEEEQGDCEMPACDWTDWGDWSECSSAEDVCDATGSKSRSRDCVPPVGLGVPFGVPFAPWGTPVGYPTFIRVRSECGPNTPIGTQEVKLQCV